MLPAANAARQEYDQLASDYDRRWMDYVNATLRVILDRGRFQGHELVLDVACGTGELERRLLSRWTGLSLVGVDLSRRMLSQAAAKDLGRQVVWVQAEASRLPFADHSFDHAVCANSFHYFPSPEQALQEVRRVLRPGGWFTLVDWCDDFWSCKLCNIWLRLTEPAFCATYTLRSCESLLETSGFEVVHADRFRVGWIWGMMCLVANKSR